MFPTVTVFSDKHPRKYDGETPSEIFVINQNLENLRNNFLTLILLEYYPLLEYYYALSFDLRSV